MVTPDWSDRYEFDANVETAGGNRRFSFLSRDGLLSKKEIRPAELALLNAIDSATGDALVLDANYGVVGTVLAHVPDVGRVTMTETSARAADCCRVNVARNGAENVDVELTADVSVDHEGYDLLAFAPKPYQPTAVNKERLAQGLSALVPGGSCYVAGQRSTGITQYANELEELTGEVTRTAAYEDCHVYRTVRPSDYEPTEYVRTHEFRESVGDYTCRFLTQPGLFSWEGLDDGTAALLSHATVPDGARTLDLCCGYGAVGAFVGARTDCELYAADDDVVATKYAQENYERNGVSPAAVRTADCLDGFPDRTFDSILSNPPTHAGKGVTAKLFGGVRDSLATEGDFWLVYNEIMNYEDALRTEFDFGSVDVVATVDSYRVTRARI